MRVRELAEKIYVEIQNRQTSTTSILRDARTLGKLLKNNDFDWVEKELKGYSIGQIPLPPYRIVDAIELKTWTGIINTSLLSIYSDWLYEQVWTKWVLAQPVSQLEDLLASGFIVDTGRVLKTLGLDRYSKRPIRQRITVTGQEIKKTLDQIQDKIQEQLADILAKPTVTGPSLGIFYVYSEQFPEIKEDLDIIVKFLETGQEYILASRACRPVLHALVRALVKKSIPNGYKFTDNNVIKNKSEKSKIKYYLEQKGESLFGDKKKIIFLDEIFREVYDISSKADKNKVNIYEACYCVDKFLKFLEQLYRYTDLIYI